ncbi:TPA_asm: hypothetical protein [Pseudomonas phage vB_PaeS-D14F]|nr:TPA_asm: hypothetical protein [Pseudomonas phage vB_PaeS-D14F]
MQMTSHPALSPTSRRGTASSVLVNSSATSGLSINQSAAASLSGRPCWSTKRWLSQALSGPAEKLISPCTR